MISFDVEHGALTQLWGGTSPEGKDLNGKVSCVLVSKYGLVANTSYLVPHPIRKGRYVLSTRARPANRPGIMDVVGGTSQKYLIQCEDQMVKYHQIMLMDFHRLAYHPFPSDQVFHPCILGFLDPCSIHISFLYFTSLRSSLRHFIALLRVALDPVNDECSSVLTIAVVSSRI
jgi:hypothetical protein